MGCALPKKLYIARGEDLGDIKYLRVYNSKQLQGEQFVLLCTW